MSFKFASVHAIGSSSQRALAEQWDRLAAGRPFPPFAELRPDPAIHDPKQLVVWNIEGSGRLRRFRALYQGENVADAFNTAWAGKTMQEVVPMSLRRPALDAAKECADTGCMVYMVLSTWDSQDNRIDCERLLLPFGRNGKVEQLLGSLQLTNVPNAERRKRALGHFEIHTEVIRSVRIRSGFTVPLAAATEVRQSDASSDTRRSPRRDVRHAARISFARKSLTCMVRNVSATGASIEAKNLAAVPDRFRMRIEMESAERQCAVVWRKPTRIGVEFR